MSTKIEKVKYSTVELVEGNEADVVKTYLPRKFAIVMYIGNRKPAMICRHGKPLTFDTNEEAKKYIKDLRNLT